MSYPTAYRSSAARDRAGTGFQRTPVPQDNTPPAPREAGPWDRPARGPTDRGPRRETNRGPYHPRNPANDNGTNPKVPNRIAEFARRGITLMRRVHPMLKWLDLIEWILDTINSRIDRGKAMNGWTLVAYNCSYSGGSAIAEPFANFCLDQQALDPAAFVQPGRTINTNRLGLWGRYSRGNFLDSLAPNGWWRTNARLEGPLPAGTPQRSPDVYFPNPAHEQEVNAPEPWVSPRPITLPWTAIPAMRPNEDAPEPIRRQTGPNRNDPEYGPQQSPAPQHYRDPFVYPPLEGPDHWINPIPWTRPGWWRNPVNQPARAPQPNPTPKPPVPPRPVDPVTPVTPRPGPIIRTAPGHRFRKPEAREKEKKKNVQGPLAAAWRKFKTGVNVVTESLDAMDCVYGALPEKIRKREQAKRHGKDPNTKGKLKLIYQHAQEVDMLSMVDCLAKEHLQDAAIGKAAKKHADLRKKYGVRGGYLSRAANKAPSINIKL